MKKLFSTMLAVGVAVLLSGTAMAHNPGDPGEDSRENDADPACTGDAICIDTTDADPNGDAPIGGVVAANGNADDPAAPSGYIFADGNGANPEPLAGYVGLNSNDDSILVGATDGHFHRAGGNSPLDPSELPMP
ncbi:MAG: hypothetical protein ACREQ9_16585 [Candidatus Binatia bacterium]